MVVWDPEGGRSSFEGLQRRAAARARTAPAPAARLPARYVAFDLLPQDGAERLTLPQRERRRLEVLFAARALTAPWALCPMTTDVAKAREWLETWTDVSGVEGRLQTGLGIDRCVAVSTVGQFSPCRTSDNCAPSHAQPLFGQVDRRGW
ncbi:hypothetical protein [Streptomyces sp. NPDC057939]|uniref:hypothetical protein n=1 Tax=Streptomyces sp. NPDC057939 TaxID=3346284 RepID=UPI0036E684AE